MEQLGTIVSKIPNECLISSQGGRNENQDTCDSVDTKFGRLLIVCDGMGGGPSGKLASTLAVDAIIRNVNSLSENETELSKIVEGAIKAANQALRDNIKNNRANTGMGTTAVVALVSKYCVTVGHVGDSRFYQLRGTGKKCMIFRTTDHSLVMQMIKETGITEEEARMTTPSNIITRALGTQDEVEVEINELLYKSGDRFVLCSDGIWGAMPESNLLEYLTQSPSLMGTVDRISIKVEEYGIEKGGRHDNHTIIIYETQTSSLLKELRAEEKSLDNKEMSGATKMSKGFKLSPRFLAVILTAFICCVFGWTLFHNGKSKAKEEKLVDSTKFATLSIKKTTEAQAVAPTAKDSLVESTILKDIDAAAANREKESKKDAVEKQVNSKADSKQNDSIKPKHGQENTRHVIELIKAIDQIIADINTSIGQYNKTERQKLFRNNAYQNFRNNILNDKSLSEYSNDVNNICEQFKQINTRINGYRPGEFEKNTTELVKNLENLKYKIKKSIKR